MEKVENKTIVIMVNYKSSEYVKSCVESLKSENLERIIVVENGSGDDEWHRLKELTAVAHCDVQLVRSLKNLGFGAGVNLGSKRVDSEFRGLLWILNPDTVVTPGCVELLAAKVISGELDVVSPAIATGSQTSPTTWYEGGSFNHSNGTTQHLNYGSPFKPSSGVALTTFMTGAAPMLSHSTWRLLGGFRESLFLYWEDADFSLRARELGLSMGVALDARIWHKEGGSGGDEGRSSSYYFYMQKNRLIVEAPYSSVRSLVAGKGTLETLRLLIRPFREKHGKAKKFVASARGLVAGIREANH